MLQNIDDDWAQISILTNNTAAGAASVQVLGGHNLRVNNETKPFESSEIVKK